MNRCMIVIPIVSSFFLVSCIQGPPSGNNEAGTKRGDRHGHQHARHNSLYAVTAWGPESSGPEFLLILRVPNLPTGQGPRETTKGADGNDICFELLDHDRETVWARFTHGKSPTESLTIFDKPYSLEDGRVFIKDTLDPNNKVIQLDVPIPFEIPNGEQHDSLAVLFAAQDMARNNDAIDDFLNQHEDSIQWLNRIRAE